MTLKVLRLDTSSYHKSDFTEKEVRKLRELKSVQVTSDLNDANVVITTSYSDIDQLLTHKDHLKLILHPNSGYDNYSYEKVQKLGVPIILGNSIRAQAVAHYAITSLMEAFNPIPFVEQWEKSRQFHRDALWKKNVLMIGKGHVGEILEKCLTPLLKNLFIEDPYLNLKYKGSLKEIDAIIVSCGLNSSSHQMINQSFLNQCREDLVLINPARGKIINEDDLLSFMKKNEKARAYLDVFEKEPCDFSLFPTNVKASSHVAGVYNELDDSVIDFVYESIRLYQNGQLSKLDSARLDLKSREHFLA